MAPVLESRARLGLSQPTGRGQLTGPGRFSMESFLEMIEIDVNQPQ